MEQQASDGFAAYRGALKTGQREYRRDTAAGHYPYLPSLDSLLDGRRMDQVSVGTMEIPLAMIAGTATQARARGFAANFMPLLDETSEFASKWESLYRAHLEEGIRDAVKVLEYRHRFYVQEGNKRVSVLRYAGGAGISAEVTRVVTPYTDTAEDRIYAEFLDFFRVCPIYDFDFAKPGDYRLFLELLGRDFKTPFSDSEISVLRASLAVFSGVYRSRAGLPRDQVQDALLVYLQVYSLDSLLNKGRSVLEKRVDGLRREILTWLRDDNICRVEQAKAAEAPAPLPFLFLGKSPDFSEKHPLRAAFIYDRTPKNSSWIYAHELGRNYVGTCFNGLVETRWYQNVNTDIALSEALQDAVEEEKCDAVFTVSPVMMKETLKAAIRYPRTHFLNCSIHMQHNAVRTYYSRMYEAKFLMGALASLMSESGRIGYRADFPIYGTVAGINAFAIGAAMMNPRAEVILRWGTEKNRDWREELAGAHVDVISGPDAIRPAEASREYGIYRTEPDGTIRNLAAPVWDWGVYYEIILRTMLNGTYEARTLTRDDQAVNYYLGMPDHVIDIVLSEKLPYTVRKTVQMLRRGILEGAIDPFGGELRSRAGRIKAEEDEPLSREQIITMNWLSDNVTGRIPEPDELCRRARDVTQVSGVPGADSAGGKERAGGEDVENPGDRR